MLDAVPGAPPRPRAGRSSPRISASQKPSATVVDVARYGIFVTFAGAILAAACAVGSFTLASGCASTEFFNEGPGQPSDRASGTVPAGDLGVCKKDGTKRPPIVNDKLWQSAPPCTSRTPDSYIRLGYGGTDGQPDDDDKQVERILQGLREGQKENSGNNQFLAMLRQVRDSALKNPALRDRVSRETARSSACDFTYLLNTMGKQRLKLAEGNACTAEAYDVKERTEACIFDQSRQEGLWLTSGWACLMHTRALGEEESCHRLCAYDDYCARQVSCAAGDIDLLLCAMGVCLPEPKAGFYY
jgi:hypothetical protein